MNDRSILGPADVTDADLARMVADLLHSDPGRTRLLTSRAEHVPYGQPAITTAGRYWVRGRAEVEGQELPYEVFVKHVQSWSRSPLFADVPDHLREVAEAGVPWRTEPLAYRSDLVDRLPPGLTMPRALGVYDLDEKSASMWLEPVPAQPVEWDLPRHVRAARLLGRLAASPRVLPLADVGGNNWHVCDYLHGRLTHQVVPMLLNEDLWRHPLVAGAFDDSLRRQLVDAGHRAEDLVEELASFPVLAGHGDACPNNLLCTAENDGFVLIDYGFWNPLPVGFDLSQLLVGDIQIGRQDASLLPAVEEAIVPAYVQGLRAEGCPLPEADVRRAHALQLLVFTGLSSVPFEHLGEPPTPALHQLAADRARIARFSLELVDATG